MITIKDTVDMISASWRWMRNQRNPVFLQAKRLLDTFEAHGVSSTEINALLPRVLQIPAICWSTPEHLSPVLTQGHIDWINDLFDLDPGWLNGRSQSAHRTINSYKSPERLNNWFEARSQLQSDRFKLHFVTSSAQSFNQQSRGVYSIVLEEFFDIADESFSRYYYLSLGAGFDHPPCVLHIMQVMAIAHYHRVIMRRCLLSERELLPLANGVGLIPTLLFKSRNSELNADHEFWSHFSGKPTWLEEQRAMCEASLTAAGLQNVVASVELDRIRFARQ
ncbi:hypothetical protein [Pseudomonas sp. 5Ae-yellow]|uniref:hypothetical protein n=1 Tax=Pseudomonas sp. 5Ae-yellow TaxID=2759848 RepID=UPI0015F3CF64|nr:hypothetical protein [Pseudomonas sp. 5Ae-yellow]MBA6421459.1 hypothetical protein [Pseudomonas sp. 5Ae-yellow]